MRKNQPNAKKSDFRLELPDGGNLARRQTNLLPDGAYFFEDELEVNGTLDSTIITCAGWLLEIFELKAGEAFFVSGEKFIRPGTKKFGVLYPPFSIARFCFNNAKVHLMGIAATEILPAEFTSVPVIFETICAESPANVKQAIEILSSGENQQSIEAYPKASLLSVKTKKLIDENYLADPSIARIAERLDVSHAHLSRQFKHDFGMSPSDYFRRLRVADAPLRLARGEAIINVSQSVGYNDLSRFYKQFRQTTNTSPGVCQTIMKPNQA